MRRFARIDLLCFAALLGACEADEQSATAPPVRALGGDVVAVVQDEAITRADVEAAMRVRGGDARSALDALEAELLLAQEARRRGISGDADAERRALAQTVLFALERQVGADRITDEEVRRAFARQSASFSHPERRAATHLLVRPKDGGPLAMDASAAFAAEVLAAVRTAPSHDEILRAARERASTRAEFTVTVEALPPFDAAASIVAPFRDAVFAAPSVGPLPAVIHTSFGLHVVVLTHIDPARTTTFAQAEASIRASLLADLRRRELTALLATLRARNDVSVREATVQRLFASDERFAVEP